MGNCSSCLREKGESALSMDNSTRVLKSSCRSKVVDDKQKLQKYIDRFHEDAKHYLYDNKRDKANFSLRKKRFLELQLQNKHEPLLAQLDESTDSPSAALEGEIKTKITSNLRTQRIINEIEATEDELSTIMNEHGIEEHQRHPKRYRRNRIRGHPQ